MKSLENISCVTLFHEMLMMCAGFVGKGRDSDESRYFTHARHIFEDEDFQATLTLAIYPARKSNFTTFTLKTFGS